jgi:hypothetical protein
MIDMENLENLIGQMVNVCVSKDGKTATKLLKVCKVKARSVLFIEVDKENRINTFRKFNRKDVATQTISDITQVKIKEGVLPDKWESSWDSIGNISRMAAGSFAYTPRPHYSNHSKGWAPVIRAPKGASMDALAVSVATRSTTNSSAGFPMV